MSVREKAIKALAEALHGKAWFDHRLEVVRFDGLNMVRPTAMPTASYDLQFGSLLEHLVDRVDWDRVLLEAQRRHLTLGHSQEDGPCGDCVAEALLAPGPCHDWTKATRIDRIPTS